MKRLATMVALFFLLTSLFALAQEESAEKSSCSGFWGSLSCFLFGAPENRAGKGWFERSTMV